MKKIYYTLILALITLTSQAQLDYGLKGGLNFNSAEQASMIGSADGSTTSQSQLKFLEGHIKKFGRAILRTEH